MQNLPAVERMSHHPEMGVKIITQISLSDAAAVAFKNWCEQQVGIKSVVIMPGMKNREFCLVQYNPSNIGPYMLFRKLLKPELCNAIAYPLYVRRGEYAGKVFLSIVVFDTLSDDELAEIKHKLLTVWERDIGPAEIHRSPHRAQIVMTFKIETNDPPQLEELLRRCGIAMIKRNWI